MTHINLIDKPEVADLTPKELADVIDSGEFYGEKAAVYAEIRGSLYQIISDVGSLGSNVAAKNVFNTTGYRACRKIWGYPTAREFVDYYKNRANFYVVADSADLRDVLDHVFGDSNPSRW